MPRTRSFADLAVSALRSADRLDRLATLVADRPDAEPVLLHERALLERRALRLLDAVRHADDPAFRWEVEGQA